MVLTANVAGRPGRKLPGLRACRDALALTQEELAERVGLSRTTVALLEVQGRGAHPGTVRRLAEALGCKPADLYRAPSDA
jgi:DNA-binding XRE family transcriptional regulator